MSAAPEPDHLAILAGSGALPRQIAEAQAGRGLPCFIVDIEGQASDWCGAYPHLRVSYGQIGRMLEALRAADCDAVTMAGGLKRPRLSDVRLDWGGMKLAPRLVLLFRKGDDGLLRGIADLFEENGLRVVAPHSLLTGALAPAGRLAGPALDAAVKADIARARAILAALGPHDVGQGAVVADGLCLAVEAAEGTAAMLARVSGLREGWRARAGVLVKAPKSGQDRRADLPAIGPDTIRDVAAAGLKGVAVEAEGAMILQRAETLAEAQRLGVFVLGFEDQG